MERRYLKSEVKDRNQEFNDFLISKMSSPQRFQDASIHDQHTEASNRAQPKTPHIQTSTQKDIWFKPPKENRMSVLFDHEVKPIFKSGVEPLSLKSAINELKHNTRSQTQLYKFEQLQSGKGKKNKNFQIQKKIKKER